MPPPTPKSLSLKGSGKCGALLLHGFTASPGEVEPIGEALHAKGFSVEMPLLPGHGTKLEDLISVSAQDWHAAAEAAYVKLQESVETIYLGGLSMGGALALILASRHPEAKALACIAMPYWLRSKWTFRGMRFLDRTGLWTVPKPFLVSKTPSPPLIIPRFSYDKYPTQGLRQLTRIINRARCCASKVTQPVLMIHARGDQTAPYESMAAYAKRFPNPPQMISLDGAEHVVTCGKDHAQVTNAVTQFFCGGEAS